MKDSFLSLSKYGSEMYQLHICKTIWAYVYNSIPFCYFSHLKTAQRWCSHLTKWKSVAKKIHRPGWLQLQQLPHQHPHRRSRHLHRPCIMTFRSLCQENHTTLFPETQVCTALVKSADGFFYVKAYQCINRVKLHSNILRAWSTNLLSICCSPTTKECNWQIISISVAPICPWQAACTYQVCAPSTGIATVG